MFRGLSARKDIAGPAYLNGMRLQEADLLRDCSTPSTIVQLDLGVSLKSVQERQRRKSWAQASRWCEAGAANGCDSYLVLDYCSVSQIRYTDLLYVLPEN